jgi:hypothetical protein
MTWFLRWLRSEYVDREVDVRAESLMISMSAHFDDAVDALDNTGIIKTGIIKPATMPRAGWHRAGR